MKTSEAKKKLCPFIQHSAICGVNIELKKEQLSDKHNAVNILCSTSDCMAWIEEIEYDYQKCNITNAAIKLEDIGYSHHKGDMWRKPINKDNGYCQRLKT